MSGVVSGLVAADVKVRPDAADDLEVDADLRQVALEELRALHALLVLRLHVDLEGALHRRALGGRLGGVLLGLLEVVVVALGVLRDAPQRLGLRIGIARGVAAQDVVDEAHVVEGMGEAPCAH